MTTQDHSEQPYGERVIVLAPTARDASVTTRLLADAGIDAVMSTGWPHVEELIRDGAGAVMLADSAFGDAGFVTLLRLLENQPSWSNLPVLALCRQGLQTRALRDANLRNLTVLDLPTSAGVMLSAVKTALRGRRWQYQIRDQIDSLLQAERSLRRADQRKDEFLATLAHELRNPLAPIRTGLQLLSRSVPGDQPQLKNVTQMMDRQMTQLLRLIDDLMEVSRISTGKLVLQQECLDMRRVVETALESCAPVIARGGHRLDVALPGEAVCVNGDLTRLAQSLSNLVNNAAKYTPDGGTVAVALERVGDEAVLTVTDSGIGLPPDMIGRVFDMFAQVNLSLDRSQGGLGIGLALVKSLVSLHGGTVSAASAGPGHGSTFTIRLPVAPRQVAPGAAEAELPTLAGAPRRILLVDDNVDAAQSLALLLSLAGHDVRVESSGAAGLARAAQFAPQLILCDIGMPGMDGYEFATRVRQDPQFAATRLAALTGWGSEADRKRSRAAGFDEHLTKPASEAAVAALLANS